MVRIAPHILFVLSAVRTSTGTGAVSVYHLSEHVRVCATPEATVLLDLRGDRYYGLDRHQTRVLASVVAGWPQNVSSEVALDTNDPAVRKVIFDLVERRFLTDDPAHGRAASPPELPLAEWPLHEWDGAALPTISIESLVKFIVAYMRTVFTFRCYRFESNVRRLERRKARRSRSRIDLSRARELNAIFRAIRPFFYTSFDRCLFDSLMMVEFFAMYGVHPTWIIGVQPTPFGAHSWVQIDGFTLNGQPEYVRSFTPILAV